MSSKAKIGLVQINNGFANQNYLPYSVGFLQAYAQKHVKAIDKFEFMLPLYKRKPLEECVKNLEEADLVLFSTYGWNFRFSSELARRIKQKKPETFIVFGGCEVPRIGREEFLANMPFVDMACYGEGERVFKKILENYGDKNWRDVPSVTFRDGNRIQTNQKTERIADLSEIPSPYLSGVFEPLMQANPDETWLGLWETNRGCPFGCAYCEWGGDYYKKLCNHKLEKILGEIDWFSQNKIEFIFCCDSNFGIHQRDLDIVRKVAENKSRYGYPKALSVQNTKNSTQKSYAIQAELAKAELDKGVNLAFQSLNPKTLEAIGRKNISNESFYQLQKQFNSEGIETFSDIILGLPEETYETLVDGTEQLIKRGSNKIRFHNLSLLTNARMNEKEYREKYGLISVESELINIHGNLAGEEVTEKQVLIVGNKTMPKEDWVKARTFGWMTSLLYFDKLLQIPMTFLNQAGLRYTDIIEEFMKSRRETLAEITGSFREKAEAIQKGEAEFCESKKWLNIWWPADELQMIKICAEGKFDRFYEESQKEMEELIGKKDSALEQAVILNKSLIKLPFQKQDLTLSLDYNIWEYYRGIITGNPAALSGGKFDYKIDKTSESWNSWEEWCKKVVWYGNKKGAYNYKVFSKPLI